MQAICDHKRRFLDIDIAHPASTSDYLAFGTSRICEGLESNGFLCKGMSICGDNVYSNTPHMITSVKSTSYGPEDAFNFYHSQICINIECAFGMLVKWWTVLRSFIPINIGIKKTIPMVHCLCYLHNFLINQINVSSIPKSTAQDSLLIDCMKG